MSFVYAENLEGMLNIHCDTKVDTDNLVGSLSKKQTVLVNTYGIVKITLICSEIGIAFAGNDIFLATNLFKQLYKKKKFSTKEVVDMAYDIHMCGDIDDIEFIIASCENNVLTLHCIKGRKKNVNCQIAWIGSPVAHREFQKYRNKNNNGKASERTDIAFQEIVQGCTDDSVGIFHISAGYNPTNNSLGYRECKTFQNSRQQTVHLNDAIQFHMEAADGGFSFEQIPVSLEDLMIKIDQMESVILYTRRFRMTAQDINNDQLFSMMLPMLIRENSNGGWIRVY